MSKRIGLLNQALGNSRDNSSLSSPNPHRRRVSIFSTTALDNPTVVGERGDNDRRSRRFSYTDFDVACYTSALASKFPIAPVNSFDIRDDDESTRPASRTNSFRVQAPSRKESLVPQFSTNGEGLEICSFTNDDSSFFEDSFSTNRLPKLAADDTNSLRMPIVSSKDPPYKHLQTSSSVDSNDTPPLEHESNASPIVNNNRLVPNKSTNDLRTNSNLTMRTTISERKKSASVRPRSSPRVHPTTSRENTRTSSNEDEREEKNTPNSPYHPNSPRENIKPMIFERGPSRTGSANLLKVPEKIAVVGGTGVVTGNFLTNNQKMDNGNFDKSSSDFDRNLKEALNNHTSTTIGNRQLFNNHQSKLSVGSKAGVYMNDENRQVDFILVYERNHPTILDQQRQYFEHNLQQEGLILESDTSDSDVESNKKHCFIRIHAPWKTLCRQAEILQMKMPLRHSNDPNDHQPPNILTLSSPGLLSTISEYFCSSFFDFNDTEKILIGGGSKHVMAQFTRNRIDKFLINDRDSFFTPTQRIRIVYEIMQKAKCDPDNGKKRGVQWLLKSGVYSGAYPPHDGDTETRNLSTNEPGKWCQRQILKHTWANFNRLFKPQPLNLIRAYFGEKIGFYFAWLGFYTQMLVFPSIIGVICFLTGVFSLSSNPMVTEMCSNDETQLHEGLASLRMCPVCRLPNCRPWNLSEGCESAHWNYRFDNETHVVMAVFTLLWATVFMELWKRKEAELAAEWDAYDAEQGDEPIRPEYEARTKSVRISPVTNEEEPYISPFRRYFGLIASASVVGFLILTVILALMALIAVRIFIYGILYIMGGFWETYKFDVASLIIHVLTFIVVMTLGTIYEPTARRLTELECPRTQADYISSYIWKVFIFEIINNFIPILYAALFRGRLSLPHNQNWLTEMCDPGGCLNEVVQAIGILLLARLLISNAAELGVPLLKSLLKSKDLGAIPVHPVPSDEQNTANRIPMWQRDFALNETDLDGVYAEYLEMMVQFGYVTLFIAVFPLAPLICLLNNIVEIRIDATNFVTAFRRPLPARVSGIRIWKSCLNIILKCSVLCNGAFLAFTSELIPTLVYRYTESEDGSKKGYMIWSMAKMNTSDWPEFLHEEPNTTVCYYRDFRENNVGYERKLIWWQIMVARLGFFVGFVITFYFVQWLCDFMLPEVPKHVKLRVDRCNFLARQNLYGQLDSSGHNSAGPRDQHGGAGFVRSTQNGRRLTESTVLPVEHHPTSFDFQKHTISNGFSKNGMAMTMNGNGHVLKDDEDMRNYNDEHPHLHPNQLPSTPLYRSYSMKRQFGGGGGTTGRLNRDTITSDTSIV